MENKGCRQVEQGFLMCLQMLQIDDVCIHWKAFWSEKQILFWRRNKKNEWVKDENG